MVLVSYFCNKH